MSHERIQLILGQEMQDARQTVDWKRFGAIKDLAKRVARLQARGMLKVGARELEEIAPAPQTALEQPFYMIPEEEGIKFIQNIGSKSPEQLEAEVKATGREVTISASDMLHSPKFEVLEEVTPQELLKAPVRAFGLPGNPTTRELFERIPLCRYGEYALELTRIEVGPHMAIADEDQAKHDYYYVMHQPTTDRYGGPRVFGVEHHSRGRFLYGRWAVPAYRWLPGDQLVVALRKIEPVES